jgi:hypothetical protein
MKLSSREEELRVIAKALPGAKLTKGTLVYEISTGDLDRALEATRRVGDLVRELD